MIADALDVKTIFDYINTGGTIGVLVFIIIAGARKWWVFGWQFKDIEDRLEKVEQSNLMWMQLALRGVDVTEQALKKTSDVR